MNANPKNPSSHARIPSQTSAILHALQKDWNNTYFPHSLVALRDLVRQYQLLDVQQYYAKTLVFVQSSGMGKSRLADAFGQLCPMINFILRGRGTAGFPPPDEEILSFLQDKPPADIPGLTSEQGISRGTSSDCLKRAVVVWNHTLAAALLQASFETCRLAKGFFLKLLLIQTLANSDLLLIQPLANSDLLLVQTLANSNNLISQYVGGEQALYHDDSRRACTWQTCRDGTT